MPDVGRRLGRVRQDVRVIVARLQERGWVGRMIVALPAVAFERAHVAKGEAEGREGPRVGVVALTKSGKKMIGNVLPSHAKVVKALMVVLDAREQESISKVCRKLRSPEAVFKFLRGDSNGRRRRASGRGRGSGGRVGATDGAGSGTEGATPPRRAQTPRVANSALRVERPVREGRLCGGEMR